MASELNTFLAEFNSTRKAAERFQPFQIDDLNKIAFWNATGSGKTLLLHINILQFREYFAACYGNRKKIDKTILLTPTEGLSRQHLQELELSGMNGIQFDKNLKALPGYVEVIDVNKLGDEMGDKVVAVDSFEGVNLVLIDEGHRGTGKEAGAWMRRREALCANGFSFEYSATFGQAVAKSKTVLQALGQKEPTEANLLEARPLAMKELYAKCVLFDYSYKFFYADGYGKESLILNLAKDNEDDIRQNYLTACLLSFFQQQWLFDSHRAAVAGFNIERPLWVFVGNKVNDDDSDVLEVLRFLARFVNNKEASVRCIEELKADQSRLLDTKNRSIFEKRFLPLSGLSAEAVFSRITTTLFNAESPQRLKVVLLKGGGGELALQLGTNDPFGVINIGDASKFSTLCKEEKEFDAESDEFGPSLFQSINKPDSKIHLLIGSRKFSEGWSSWRVSTMGLMNMGRGEGSQIIQLFGRGVRLKGRDYSLKRSRTNERPKGVFLDKLETLNIFGIRADYMAQFKEYLREEGITPSDEILEVSFETKRHAGNGNLKTLALKEGHKAHQKGGFKRNVWPELFHIPADLRKKIKPPQVKLDLYAPLGICGDPSETFSGGNHFRGVLENSVVSGASCLGGGGSVSGTLTGNTITGGTCVGGEGSVTGTLTKNTISGANCVGGSSGTVNGTFTGNTISGNYCVGGNSGTVSGIFDGNTITGNRCVGSYGTVRGTFVRCVLVGPDSLYNATIATNAVFAFSTGIPAAVTNVACKVFSCADQNLNSIPNR